MAPEVVWKELPSSRQRLRILDPMAGSGTTLVTARLRGHDAIGFDRDPLAVLIANAWISDVDPEATQKKAKEVLSRARERAKVLNAHEAFPAGADDETKQFVRYWFDDVNRIQLAALSNTIGRLRDSSLRGLMWCALSRLIITKQAGVSLAMDISHSRPHKKYNTAPIKPFDHFTRAARQVIKASPFTNKLLRAPRAVMENADARRLPLKDNNVDLVITSPPYLNAIDYVRGHKFSLVWMGYSVADMRDLRATNVGSEITAKAGADDGITEEIMRSMCDIPTLTSRHAGMLRQYVRDIRTLLAETHRVLRRNGKAIIVIGDCNLRQTFVKNSRAIEIVAEQAGFVVKKIRRRPLPENRRYLPPPGATGSGKELRKRMREEVIFTLLRP
jgi:DNA modification methylase